MSCDNFCDPVVVGAVGAQGAPGLDGLTGTNGVDGVNAYSTLTSTFTQPNVYPAAGNSVTLSVSSTSWMGLDQILYVEQAGYYRVTAVNSTTSVTCYLQTALSVLSGQTVSSGRKISPGGFGFELSASPASLSVNSNALSNANALVVYGSSALPLLQVNATLNKVGVNVSPAAGNKTFAVGGTCEVASDIQSGGLVEAPRFRITNTTAEWQGGIVATVSQTITLAGTVGAVTAADYTVSGANLGKFVLASYNSDPVTTFETDVAFNPIITGLNTVRVFFTNTSTNAYSSVSISLKFLILDFNLSV